MQETSPMQAWTISAINLPEHADNPVHTDAGARAAGYERALVAGTTVYAYLTHPPAAAWGEEWVGGGGAEVRFLSPVFHDDTVECAISGDPPGTVVAATVGGEVRATYAVNRTAQAPERRGGEALAPFLATLDEHLVGYGRRCGDDLALYDRLGVVHPVVWTTLANRTFIMHLVDGPWIHTRSRVVHLGLAPSGSEATISATVVDRFESRAGERALVDVWIEADGRPVAYVEHEAIVRLRER